MRGGPRRFARASILALALLAPRESAAQSAITAAISAQNLLETQIGGDPFRTGAADQVDFYDQANLQATFSAFRLGVRYETNRTSLEAEQPSYSEFSQRWAEWEEDRLRVRVGNLYTLIGRGLVHRSFELKGIILDDVSTFSRFAPTRDMDGALVEANSGPFEATLLSGSPNLGQLAPSAPIDARYSGQLNVASGGVRLPRGSRIGGSYARFAQAGAQTEIASGSLDLDPLQLAGVESVQSPFYVEYAMLQPDFDRYFGFPKGPGTALYASANALWGPLGISAEWKSYRDFTLGFNDPPSLVREHTFLLLNRSTHILDANHEDGYQIEGSSTLGPVGTVTVNLSRADAQIVTSKRFEERYVELHTGPGNPYEATVFFDDGKDTFPAASVSDRTVAGAAGTVTLRDVWGIHADVEFLDEQKVNFFGTPTNKVVERYAMFGFSREGWGAISAQWERTTDPIYADPAHPEDPNNFFSATLTGDLSSRHQVRLFAGERRGGPACTAGTCYIVAPFEGVELRLTSRF